MILPCLVLCQKQHFALILHKVGLVVQVTVTNKFFGEMSTFLSLTIILATIALFQEGIYGLHCTANDDCLRLKNGNKFCCKSNVCQICPTCNGSTDCGPLEFCCKQHTSYRHGNTTSRYCRSSCIGAFCESYDDCGDYCCRSNRCVNCSQTFCRSHSECQSGQYCCSNGYCEKSCTGLSCYSSDGCASQSECCKSFRCVQCRPCVNHAECKPFEYCCKNVFGFQGLYSYRECGTSCIGAFCETSNDCGKDCCRSNKCVVCQDAFCRSHSECQPAKYCCSNGQCRKKCTGNFCGSNDSCAPPNKCCKSLCTSGNCDSNDSSKSSGFPLATFFSVVVMFIVIAVILFICYKKQKKRATPPALGQEFVYETANIERLQNNIPPLAFGERGCAAQEVILYPPLYRSVQGTVELGLSPPSYSIHDPLAPSDTELHLETVDNPNTPPPPYVINEQTVSSETNDNNDQPPSYEDQA